MFSIVSTNLWQIVTLYFVFNFECIRYRFNFTIYHTFAPYLLDITFLIFVRYVKIHSSLADKKLSHTQSESLPSYNSYWKTKVNYRQFTMLRIATTLKNDPPHAGFFLSENTLFKIQTWIYWQWVLKEILTTVKILRIKMYKLAW